MSDFGVTDLGFRPKREADVLAELEAQARAEFGEDVATGRRTFLGQVLAIVALALGSVWALLYEVWRSGDPRFATGASLDASMRFTGHARLGPSPTLVDLLLEVEGGNTVPAGSLAVHEPTGAAFASRTDGTDGQLVRFECQTNGPIRVLAGEEFSIGTPQTGWAAVTAPQDGLTGSLTETDAELKRRHLRTPQRLGAGTPGALKAALLQEVPGVSDVLIWQDDYVSGPGLVPSRPVEIVVDGGDEALIAQVIHRHLQAGDRLHSTAPAGSLVQQAATDSQGRPRTIVFSRPETVQHYLTMQIEAPSALTDSELGRVKSAILERAQAEQGVGESLSPWRYYELAGLTGRDVTKVRLYAGRFVPNVLVALGPEGQAPELTRSQKVGLDSTRVQVVQFFTPAQSSGGV